MPTEAIIETHVDPALLPNAETIEAMQEARHGNLESTSSIAALIANLDTEDGTYLAPQARPEA